MRGSFATANSSVKPSFHSNLLFEFLPFFTACSLAFLSIDLFPGWGSFWSGKGKFETLRLTVSLIITFLQSPLLSLEKEIENPRQPLTQMETGRLMKFAYNFGERRCVWKNRFPPVIIPRSKILSRHFRQCFLPHKLLYTSLKLKPRLRTLFGITD